MNIKETASENGEIGLTVTLTGQCTANEIKNLFVRLQQNNIFCISPKFHRKHINLMDFSTDNNYRQLQELVQKINDGVVYIETKSSWQRGVLYNICVLYGYKCSSIMNDEKQVIGCNISRNPNQSSYKQSSHNHKQYSQKQYSKNQSLDQSLHQSLHQQEKLSYNWDQPYCKLKQSLVNQNHSDESYYNMKQTCDNQLYCENKQSPSDQNTVSHNKNQSFCDLDRIFYPQNQSSYVKNRLFYDWSQLSHSLSSNDQNFLSNVQDKSSNVQHISYNDTNKSSNVQHKIGTDQNFLFNDDQCELTLNKLLEFCGQNNHNNNILPYSFMLHSKEHGIGVSR